MSFGHFSAIEIARWRAQTGHAVARCEDALSANVACHAWRGFLSQIHHARRSGVKARSFGLRSPFFDGCQSLENDRTRDASLVARR
jgi:hypothetical protein